MQQPASAIALATSPPLHHSPALHPSPSAAGSEGSQNLLLTLALQVEADPFVHWRHFKSLCCFFFYLSKVHVSEVFSLSIKMPVRRGHVALQNTYLDTIIRKFDEQSKCT